MKLILSQKPYSPYIDCGGIAVPHPFVTLSYTLIILIQIVIPLIIIVMGSIDFAKSSVSNNQEIIKLKQKQFLKRLLACLMSFLAISFIKITLSITSTNMTSCLKCLSKGEKFCNGPALSINNPDFPEEANEYFDPSAGFVQPGLRPNAYNKPNNNNNIIIITSNDKWDIAFNITGASESNNDPGVISNISWDRGGKSYGAYQFASNMGTTSNFINWLKNNNFTSWYNRLSSSKVGSSSFDSEWKKIASEDKRGFLVAQQKYMIDNFYYPAINTIRKYATNFDPGKYTVALNSMIISTSTQFGPAGSPFRKIFSGAYDLNNELNLLLGFKEKRISSFPTTRARYEKEYIESVELYNKYKSQPFGS